MRASTIGLVRVACGETGSHGVRGANRGRWVLTEAKGFCNARVPEWLLQRLRRWLVETQAEFAEEADA